MTKLDLIDQVAEGCPHLGYKDVELAVKALLEEMSLELAQAGRIEVRGFGSFSLHHRPERIARNPKTGEAVSLPSKHVAHFKPGQDLRDRVNNGMNRN